MPASIRTVTVLAFGTVAAVVLVVGAMGYRTVRRADDANQLVVHTYQVLNALDSVIVKAHDGRVTVISPGIGAGTTFTVVLPVVRVPDRV